jgi:hypothetical protein
MEDFMKFPIMILCLVVSFSACNNKSGYTYQKNENLPQLKVEWELEYEMWKKLAIQDYQFIFHDKNTYPIRITVKEGAFHNVEARGRPESYSYYETIDDLFMTIARGFESDDRNDHHPEQIRTSYTVRYHHQYHYPEYYSIISVIATSRVGGNGWGFSVDKFSRLEDLEEETWQPNKNMPKLLDEWEKQYEAWKSLNIKDYQFVLKEYLDPAQFVYNEYHTQLIVRDGYGNESIGLYPDTFLGGATWTIDDVFTRFVYNRFEEEIYYGWDNWPRIGMYFEIEYDPVYHYPTYFKFGDIYDPSWQWSNPQYRGIIRTSEFKLLK